MFEFLKSPPKIWFRFLPSSSSHSNGPTFFEFFGKIVRVMRAKKQIFKIFKISWAIFRRILSKNLITFLQCIWKAAECLFVRSIVHYVVVLYASTVWTKKKIERFFRNILLVLITISLLIERRAIFLNASFEGQLFEKAHANVFAFPVGHLRCLLVFSISDDPSSLRS